MQGVTVSWVGQSFALPRCSASSESKPRTRRTKEERRTMVMSFIKKYQSSNNGKFPSLNLTHKEVGGSFYTIREIVRDIIQENKVLGPGNLSSKLLSLEYYSEGEEDKGSFLDVHSNRSILTAVNEIDQVHHEVVSSMEQEISSFENIEIENIEIIKPITPVLSNTLLNENSSWQVLQGEPILQNFSDGIVLHEEVVKTGTKISNVHVPTERKDVSGGVHQVSAEVQPSSSDDMSIQYAMQSVPVYSILSGTSIIETELKNEDTCYKIPVESNFLEENTNISETSLADTLPGTNLFFTDIIDDQKNCLLRHDNGKISSVGKNFGEDNSLETSVLSIPNTSMISRSGHKVHLTSEPFEDGSVIKSSELETAGLNSSNSIFNTSETSCIPNEGVVPFIPFDKEHIGTAQPREITEREVYVAEEKNVDNLVLQTICLADKSNKFVDVIKESENVSNKLSKPIIQEAYHAEFKVEKQSDVSDMLNGESFISSSNEKATKESEIVETNPLWAAIKSLVSSFVKFWSE